MAGKNIATAVSDEYKALFAALAEARGISQAALLREYIPTIDTLQAEVRAAHVEIANEFVKEDDDNKQSELEEPDYIYDNEDEFDWKDFNEFIGVHSDPDVQPNLGLPTPTVIDDLSAISDDEWNQLNEPTTSQEIASKLMGKDVDGNPIECPYNYHAMPEYDPDTHEISIRLMWHSLDHDWTLVWNEELVTTEELLAECKKLGNLACVIEQAGTFNPIVKQCVIHAAKRLAHIAYPTQAHKDMVLGYMAGMDSLFGNEYYDIYPEDLLRDEDKVYEITGAYLYHSIRNKPLMVGSVLVKTWDYGDIRTTNHHAIVHVNEQGIRNMQLPQDILSIGQQAISDGKLLTQDLYYEDGRPIWNKFMLMALLTKERQNKDAGKALLMDYDLMSMRLPKAIQEKHGIILMPQVEATPQASTTKLGKRLGKAVAHLRFDYVGTVDTSYWHKDIDLQRLAILDGQAARYKRGESFSHIDSRLNLIPSLAIHPLIKRRRNGSEELISDRK